MQKGNSPLTPGEILAEEFMEPLGVSQNRLARDMDVPVSRISGIVKGERSITGDTALRLAAFFGTTPEFWMNLQADYDLRSAKRAKGSEISSKGKTIGNQSRLNPPPLPPSICLARMGQEQRESAKSL